MDSAKNQIISKVKNVLLQLKNDHDIKAAYLYGSYANGTQNISSDIDIAIIPGNIKTNILLDEEFEIFHKMQEVDSLFESICFNENRFNNDESLLVINIKKKWG